MRYIEIIWEYLKTGCAYLYSCVGYAAVLYAAILTTQFVVKQKRKKSREKSKEKNKEKSQEKGQGKRQEKNREKRQENSQAGTQACHLDKSLTEIRRISFQRYLAEFGLILWVCLIFKVTGMLDITYWETPKITEVLNAVCRIPFLGNAFSMIVLNLLLFVPFGFLLSVVIPDFGKSGEKVFLSGLLLSVGIEMIQLFSGRMFEVDDMIANSLGTLFGYLLFRFIQDIGKALSKQNGIEDRINGQVENGLQNEPTGEIENGVGDERKEELKTGLKRMAFTGLAYGVGLFLISFVADGEKTQWQEEKEYPGIDGDEAAIEDICEMKLLSPKGTYSEAGIRSSDFDVAFRWMAMGIGNAMSSYSAAEDISNAPKLSDEVNLRSDYIEIHYSSPHTFRFVNKKDFLMQDVQYLLYDAISGEIWYGEAADRINGHLEYSNDKYPFSPDEDLIYIIENGKGES